MEGLHLIASRSYTVKDIEVNHLSDENFCERSQLKFLFFSMKSSARAEVQLLTGQLRLP